MLFGFRTLWFLAFDQRLVPVVIEFFNLWRGVAEGLFACLLIAAVVAAEGGVHWLRHPRAALTGDLSFGIYLFHFPVMWLVAWGLYRLFGISGTSPLLHTSLLLGLTLLVVFPLSWLGYRWVERPGILAGRALSQAPRDRRVPAGLS
jgi:peptidoglycan/LPS O-acetylase OafA/YrhL